MKRWLSISVALAVVGSLVAVFYPHASESNGPILPAETKELSDAFPEVGLLRALAMDLLAREVAAGRRSLVDAAALYRELKRAAPEPFEPTHWVADESPAAFPGRTEEERLCQQVVAHVRVALRDGPPGEVEATVARLEAELRDELCRRGAIRLADPSEMPPVEEFLDQARQAMTEAERRRRRR